MTDQRLTSDVQSIRDELEEFRSRFEEEVEDSPRRNRLARAERVQIAVAIAIVTAYFSLTLGTDPIDPPSPLACFQPGNAIFCTSSIQVLLAAVFLISKTAVMTTLPIYSEDDGEPGILEQKLRGFDSYWLPAMFVPLVLFSIIAGVLFYLFGFSKVISSIFGPVGPIIFIATYISLETVVFFILGQAYAEKFKTAMEDLRTESPNNPITISRGVSGSSSEFWIENDSDEPIHKKSLEFVVDAPDDLEISISQAYHDDGRWVYTKEIAPGDDKRIPVEVKTKGLQSQTAGEFTIKVFRDGEKIEEEVFRTR